MKKRYEACMVLHAVGDTVGFKNSEWEFKRGTYEKTLEKLYEYIELGGTSHISLEGWIVSDDTVMHMKTAEGLLGEWSSMNSLGGIFREKFIEAYVLFLKEGRGKRWPGDATMNSIGILKDGGKWDSVPYNLMSGGSGASMRCLCVGLAFHGEANRDKLIQISIETSRMTNNSAIGYLGGFASALFTALAIEGIEINNWPFILLELLSSKIPKYIKSAGRNIVEYETDHHVFAEKWHRYIEDKFDATRGVIIRKTNRNLVSRGKYYNETFGLNSNNLFIGSGGDDSVIIAYDCLVDSGNNWEKLVIYSMLHVGDADTTGAIAAGFYGALYGFADVSDNFLANLEYKDELIGLGDRLFEKYY